MNEDEVKLIERFLDEDGRVKQLPSKQIPRDAVLRYLAGKFASDTDYKEREVNAILTEWHTFNDYFIVRRSLVEAGYLHRLNDGSKYWKEEIK